VSAANADVVKNCPHCGDSRIAYKSKASVWECLNCEGRFVGEAPEISAPRISDHAARPKAIFFSYGHDDNRDLVHLFKNDLEKRGHQVWFDEKDIGSWDDWKGRITRGIDASQLAIAFMSKHSIRDPGVCRNEIAIAMNRFGAVYPILLETGIEQDIPVTIRHMHWPDLSRWKEIRDGNLPETDWDRWYEEKLLNLVEKIERDATRFADETRVLREALLPASFEAKIAQHVPGFIGREWIVDAYRHWVDHQPESRLFWINAGPGVGKSAIAANLAHRQRSAIVASWFCDAKSSELKDPNKALKSIAFQLALRWEDYRVKLLRKLELYASATDGTCEEVRKELEKKNTQDLFLFLLAEPMAGLIWREHKLVVVIDALDEATDEQGNNRITELIAKELSSLPEWIGFVVTSRPEAEVVNRLCGFKFFEIDAGDPRNLADLRDWYKRQLGRRPELSELPEAEQQRIEDQLIERSSGMILYLKVVEEGFREGSLTVAGLEGLESGLPGLYRRYYDSFQQRFGTDYETSVKPLLRLLLAAGGPLPEDLACEVLAWNSEQFLTCRNRLGSYVVETLDGHELFHKTLAEWLSGKSSGPFYLDRTIGRQLLADMLFKEIADKESHLVRWPNPIKDWLFAWLPKLSQYTEPLSVNKLGSTFADWGVYSRALSLFEYANVLSETLHGSEHDDTVAILINLAGLHGLTGEFNASDTFFRRALSIREKTLGPTHPGTGEALNDFAVQLFYRGDCAAAEPLCRRALAIRQEALGSDHLCVAESMNNLAFILKATGNVEAAGPIFRRALAIREAALGLEHPKTGESLNNLAIFLRDVGDLNAAEPLFRRALAIAEQCRGTEHPHIAATLGGLATLLKATGQYAEAEILLRRSLAIKEKLFSPEHATIAITLNKLAEILVITGNRKAAESVFERALRIEEKALGHEHPDVVEKQARLDLVRKNIGG
jgi:tetratricopeptide (TPR) repeat protein